MPTDDVLIVGAGPTGLALALWLTQQGVKVRIIDKTDGPGTTSRAMAVQARTLELYRQLDLAATVVAAGHPNPALNLWVRGQRRAHLGFRAVGEQVTPYPFVLTYPQDLHERLLVERLAALGVAVERQTELLDFSETGTGVVARARRPDGQAQSYEARFLAGCDGARSLVRHRLGAGFEGGTYKHLFYVADVVVSGLEPADEIHVALDEGDFVAVFPYGNAGRRRLVGTVRADRADRAETLTFDDVAHVAIERLGLQVEAVGWFSTYHVHHRVTDRFRMGAVFLLGDAAHIHSPVGGQGMNTGIQDAINLAWKLAAVLRGDAPDGLLDTYEAERRAFARQLVDTTDRLFTFVTAEGSFADFVRTRIAPPLISAAYGIDSVREFVFRLVSQTMVHYQGSPLSQGTAGKVHGGDRLPWVGWSGPDNYAPLSEITWQVHVYGDATPDLRAWCETHGLPLHVFDWHDHHDHAGLARNAAYLLRPDTYVALAEPVGSAERLETYRQEQRLRFAPVP